MYFSFNYILKFFKFLMLSLIDDINITNNKVILGNNYLSYLHFFISEDKTDL